MPRIKQTPSRTVVKVGKGAKKLVLKKIADAASKAKALIHTGKLKVPFKPASIAHAKKGLIKQLRRR